MTAPSTLFMVCDDNAVNKAYEEAVSDVALYAASGFDEIQYPECSKYKNTYTKVKTQNTADSALHAIKAMSADALVDIKTIVIDDHLSRGKDDSIADNPALKLAGKIKQHFNNLGLLPPILVLSTNTNDMMSAVAKNAYMTQFEGIYIEKATYSIIAISTLSETAKMAARNNSRAV